MKQRRWMQSVIATTATLDVVFPWNRKVAVATVAPGTSVPARSRPQPLTRGITSKLAAH